MDLRSPFASVILFEFQLPSELLPIASKQTTGGSYISANSASTVCRSTQRVSHINFALRDDNGESPSLFLLALTSKTACSNLLCLFGEYLFPLL
jgi:hypothetical protein